MTSSPASSEAHHASTPSSVASGSALRDRLPRVSAAHADALRTFFGSPQRLQLSDGGELRLRPTAAPNVGDVAQVEGEGLRVALQFDGDGNGTNGGLQWSDYSGRARTLAWSLAHEAPLMRLSDALGIALLPIAVADAQAARDDDSTWLAFSIESGDLDSSEALPACSGRLRIPSAWLQRLRARAAPSYEDDPLPSLQRWIDLPARVAIRLAGPTLPADQWRTLRLTDVIIAGRRSRPAVIEATFGDRAWPISGATGRWRVEGPARVIAPTPHSTPDETSTMNSMSSAPGEAGDDGAARNLPVRLEFELGDVELTLGELASLQPGYVFNLPAHLEGANVTVRANGRPAGRGEVVAVGDTLGVRLLSWS